MAADPTAAYRKQQGLGTIGGGADPKLIGWIRQASRQTGADPAALLATSLQESGGRLNGPAGDRGTSFGPFQFHIGGALGSHPPAWASTYAAVLNRAQEFKRLGVHGGPGAAAVQRPFDRSLYAQGVNAQLARARELLGQHAAIAAAQPKPAAVDTPSGSVIPGYNLLQSLIDASAQNAGIGSITLPTLAAAPQQAAAPTPNQPGKPKPTTPQNAFGKVVATPNPKIIGTPYHGTHTLGNWESDNAVDIAIPTGTPIYAPSDGVIGSQIGSLGAAGNSRFAGLRVHLKTGGNELYYAHLSRLAVKAGQRVKAGQIIGYSGSANGVQHLHLGVRKGNPALYA